jgi:hypothetical protein
MKNHRLLCPDETLKSRRSAFLARHFCPARSAAEEANPWFATPMLRVSPSSFSDARFSFKPLSFAVWQRPFSDAFACLANPAQADTFGKSINRLAMPDGNKFLRLCRKVAGGQDSLSSPVPAQRRA